MSIRFPASRRASLFVFAGALSLVVAAGFLLGRDPVALTNVNNQGLAIKGYDPVAYFEQSQPVPGNPQFTHQWSNATWRFSSAANRDKFAANPEQYAPQFGGYCAWAVSKGYTADTDPAAWKIIGGKLYLNYNKSIQKKWEDGVTQRIADAEKNWPALHR